VTSNICKARFIGGGGPAVALSSIQSAALTLSLTTIRRHGGGASAAAAAVALCGGGQGLTLVHFSGQPEPFWPLTPVNHPAYHQKVLTLSREVDECKALAVGLATR